MKRSIQYGLKTVLKEKEGNLCNEENDGSHRCSVWFF